MKNGTRLKQLASIFLLIFAGHVGERIVPGVKESWLTEKKGILYFDMLMNVIKNVEC